MELREGAGARNRKRRSSWFVVGAVLVASAAGGCWVAAPTMMDALRKAAAVTDALLAKVMWSLCGTGLISQEGGGVSVARRSIDRALPSVPAAHGGAGILPEVPHDVFKVLAKSFAETLHAPDPPLTTNAATTVFGV